MPGVEPPQPINPIQGLENVSPSESVSSASSASSVSSTPPTSDSETSTIEESKLIASLFLPLVSSFPILKPPGNDEATVDSLSSILRSLFEAKKMSFLLDIMSQWGEMIDRMNQIFEDNLEAIREETKRIMKSTSYLIREEIRKADPHSDKVGSVTSIGAAEAASIENKIKNIDEEAVISLDRLDKFSQKIKEQSDLEIPFTVLFTVAGSLALGKMSVKNEAVEDLVKFVEKIQPAVPKIKVEEIQPLINLMVMALIIFRPLDEGMTPIKENEQQNFAKKVEEFAKDVIKMVNDPTFALLTIVNNIEKIHHLNSEEKRQFIATLKLILTSVALSLLYSLEVGKIQGDKFFGMEPLEFRALLDPTKPLLEPKPVEKMSSQEKLFRSLIHIIREQMAELPPEQISSTIDSVLSYLEKSRNVGKLLDPSKVLGQVLQSMNYVKPNPDPFFV